MSFVKKRGALCPSHRFLEFKLLADVGLNLCHRNSYLLHGISVTNGYAAVTLGVEVVGDAEGSTDLVLAAVSLTDRAGLVEVDGEFLSKLVVKLERLVGKLLGKRKHGCLEGSKCGMEVKNGTNVAALKLLFIVSVNKECEPSLGADRVALAFLVDAYDEETIGEGDVRVVLHLHPALAPVKAAVLPLSKKLSEKALELYDELAKYFPCDFDETGSIGKRYRREDEIGTPFCITYDFDTENDGCVTVRDRDTMEQVRIPMTEVKDYIAAKLRF